MNQPDGDTLAIYLDLKDPASYLALPGTLKLLVETECAARWHPLQISLPQQPGPEPDPTASRGDRHRWFRASYRSRELHYYANVLDLPLEHMDRHCESTASALSMLWLAKHNCSPILVGQLLLTLGRTHYSGAMNHLDDSAMLCKLIDGLEMDGGEFASYCGAQGRSELQQALAQSNAAGVTRGPAYRYQDSLYIGREHLPLLREQITG